MAKNEFGVQLDRNGYAPSIIPDHNEHRCWLCGRNGTEDRLDRHEVFGGPYRSKSKRLGLWVYLCHHECHESGRNAVHQSKNVRENLMETAQRAAMERYDWSVGDFVRQFGKNHT